MKKLTILLTIAVIMILTAVPVVAQDVSGAEADASSITNFNRNLVKSVEKGCIYIWIMNMEAGYPRPAGIGSGVIFMAVPEENVAYALTNHHVGRDSTLLQVETWDKATYRAQTIATEPGIDCSLIRIDGIPRDRYEPCILGNSDNVRMGDLGLAIGAPGFGDATNTDRSDPYITFGLHQSATLRVVSGRSTNPYLFIRTWASWKSRQGHQIMTNLPWRFVTQSAISGGNSGGPLFNSRGECIGLNHAHFGGGAGLSQHENYSIPINFCKKFAFQMLDTGKYELPWFGMDVLMPRHFDDYAKTAEFVERHLDEKKFTVFDIRRDSPAERAGLERYDVITEFDGRTFANTTELRMYIFDLEIGREIPIVVKRGKQEIEITMEVGVKRSYDSEFSL